VVWFQLARDWGQCLVLSLGFTGGGEFCDIDQL